MSRGNAAKVFSDYNTRLRYRGAVEELKINLRRMEDKIDKLR